MKRADLNPALIYATKKTGLLLTESNTENFTQSELREWSKAVNEYNRRVEKGYMPEI